LADYMGSAEAMPRAVVVAAFAPGMAARGKGSIINISSI
jgi:short-subunit dehydrogenase